MSPAGVALRNLLRDNHTSILVGPAGIADRLVAILRGCGDALEVMTAADLRRPDVPHRIDAIYPLPSDPPALIVFDLRGRIIGPDEARVLYHADLSARGGALHWCVVMTPLAYRCMLNGTRDHGWPCWSTRATDIGQCPETEVLLAPLHPSTVPLHVVGND